MTNRGINLPGEILLAIADKAEISTLTVLSRTCRLFLASSRRRLFERVSVRVRPKDVSTAADILAKPDLNCHVRWLVLVSPNVEEVFIWGPESYKQCVVTPWRTQEFLTSAPNVKAPSMSELAKRLVKPFASNLCGLSLRCSQKIHKHPSDHDNVFHMGRAVLSTVRCPSLRYIHMDTDEIFATYSLWNGQDFSRGLALAPITEAYEQNMSQIENLDMTFFTQYPNQCGRYYAGSRCPAVAYGNLDSKMFAPTSGITGRLN